MNKIKGFIWWFVFLFFGALLAKKPGASVQNWQTIEKVLKRVFGNTTFLYLADENYWLPVRSQVTQFLKEDETDKFKYKKDWFDCDDFSLVLTAKSIIKNKWHFIITDSRVHSYNSIILAEGLNVLLIEPQNDKVFTPEKFQEFTKKLPICSKKRKKLPLPLVQAKVKSAVRKASLKTIGKSVDEYFYQLFEEMKAEGIEDEITEVYKTRFVRYV